LNIRCCVSAEYLSIVIMDDGAGCNFDDKSFKEGIGLSNVKARLKQLYGTNHTLDFSSNQQGGVTVSLSLKINVGDNQ
jgi:two-component system, LytTR family, sensor kinase